MRRSLALAVFLVFLIAASASGEDALPAIKLPPPQVKGGKPLMETLKARETTRSFSARELPPQVLSNLLWAAFGINRPASGKRTAPSARNWQEIDIYVALARGLYLYNPKANTLEAVLAGDIRGVTGRQDFTSVAPVNLIYVADYSRMGSADREAKVFYSATDTGFISQNVYLFCASEGLATVVLGWVDKELLAKTMKLPKDRKVILTQPVGYPK